MTETIPPLTTSTNLGPMITPMSFPGDCLSSLYDFNTLGLGLPWTYQTQGCALSTCCPYGNYYTEGYAWLTSYYSPAVCPVSYKKCPLPTKLASLSSVGGESIALCCPHEYQCWSDSNGGCGSLMGDPTSVIVLDNIFVQSIVSTRSWTLPLSMATQGQEQWQIAYPLQIRWKDGDWKSGTAATTTGGGGSSSIPTGTQVSSGPTATSPGNSAATSSSSSKLSAGSIAGIVTGSVSAVIGILGFAFKVYKWRHPKPRLNEDGGGEGLKIKNNA